MVVPRSIYTRHVQNNVGLDIIIIIIQVNIIRQVGVWRHFRANQPTKSLEIIRIPDAHQQATTSLMVRLPYLSNDKETCE